MTGIQWTDETWNPTTGCDRVSPGCDNCYALTMAGRLKGMGQAKYQRDGDPRTSGPGFGIAVHPDALAIPSQWHKPRRVFVNSMSDLFHEGVPDEFIAKVFAVMASAPRHTFQVLTKRHGRLRSLVGSDKFRQSVQRRIPYAPPDDDPYLKRYYREWPLPNVWLGVSAEDQKWANIRIPALLDTPARVRFLSCEPLLGPLNIWNWIDPATPRVDCDKCGEERFVDEIGVGHECTDERWCSGPSAGVLPRSIDWVIVGGESGPGARPMLQEWALLLRDQCEAAEVPFFCKQLGSVLGRQFGAGPKGGDWDAWPEDLRVREFPVAAKAAA